MRVLKEILQDEYDQATFALIYNADTQYTIKFWTVKRNSIVAVASQFNIQLDEHN